LPYAGSVGVLLIVVGLLRKTTAEPDGAVTAPPG